MDLVVKREGKRTPSFYPPYIPVVEGAGFYAALDNI
jgi:hypothetical protein